MEVFVRKLKRFLMIALGCIAVLFILYTFANIWGMAIPFELVFTCNSMEPVRSSNDTGFWYSVYSDSYYTLDEISRMYPNETGEKSIFDECEFDFERYTYIICGGSKLRRFARFPIPFDGVYIGKAIVELDHEKAMNVYRISKMKIDVGHPPSGSSDFTMVLPKWFPCNSGGIRWEPRAER